MSMLELGSNRTCTVTGTLPYATPCFEKENKINLTLFRCSELRPPGSPIPTVTFFVSSANVGFSIKSNDLSTVL